MSSAADVNTLIGTLTGPLIGIVVSLTLSISNYIRTHTHNKYLLDLISRISVIESKFGNISPDKIKEALSLIETLDPDIQKQIDSHDGQIKDVNSKILDIIKKLEAIQTSGVIPKSTTTNVAATPTVVTPSS